MEKFYAVQAYLNHSDDFELIGIFSKEDEANQFAEELRESGRCPAVVPPEHLEMPVILEILLRDRLRELAEPIRAIAVGMGLQMKREKDSMIQPSHYDPTNLRGSLTIPPEPNKCTWQADDLNAAFDTYCGNKWAFFDGGPAENHMKFCPYCGKPLTTNG